MRRRRFLGSAGLLLALVAALDSPSTRADDGPIGFNPASRAAQAKAEAHALTIPTPDAARAWLKSLTEEPHVAGTPADKKTAEDVRDKLRSWGWTGRPRRVRGPAQLPDPLGRRDRPARATQPLKVTEDAVVADKDSASPDAFPAFHGYGASGDVTAPGRLRQLRPARGLTRVLERSWASTSKGKIVLARYGEIFRGLKVRNAQKKRRRRGS